jgi:hypothetical protein
MTAEFEAQDRLWANGVTIAAEAAAKANDAIREQCVAIGIPADKAPQLELSWSRRSSDYARPTRRAELRKLAETRLGALTKTAKVMIDQQALDFEEELIIGGLESDDARSRVDSMPTVAELMPPLSLDDLGVKHWQPPKTAAGELLAPSTPAQRRRKIIRQAIEANPGASDRAIAKIAGFDHKTVAAYRSRGELPAVGGEFPTDSEDVVGDGEA